MDVIRSFPTLGSLSEAAANEIEQLAAKAISERGRFTIALSGGNTPRSLYEELAKRSFDWSHIHLFWGDERYVPHDNPGSNYRMAKESLLDHIDIPGENIHPISTDFSNPEDAAQQYESALRSFFGEDVPQFDLILLGLGEDGHTASLFPGAEFHSDDTRWTIVTHSPKPPLVRVSLTLNVINHSHNVFFLVGKEKSAIFNPVLDDKERPTSIYPSACVRATEKLMWFVENV